LAQGGAPCASIDVTTDQSGGMSVSVELSEPGLEPAARVVLGRFPFAFSISIAAQPTRSS